MMVSAPQKIACPTCNKKVDWDPANPFRPFCCERCKLIDLGKWANEDYRIPLEGSEENVSIPDNDEGD